jgi:hypothetical protein
MNRIVLYFAVIFGVGAGGNVVLPWPLLGHFLASFGLKDYLTGFTLFFYQRGIRCIGIIITDTMLILLWTFRVLSKKLEKPYLF